MNLTHTDLADPGLAWRQRLLDRAAHDDRRCPVRQGGSGGGKSAEYGVIAIMPVALVALREGWAFEISFYSPDRRRIQARSRGLMGAPRQN